MSTSHEVDGDQWILIATVDGRERVFYFDNELPDAVDRFSAALHDRLDRNGRAQAQWRRIPASCDRGALGSAALGHAMAGRSKEAMSRVAPSPA